MVTELCEKKNLSQYIVDHVDNSSPINKGRGRSSKLLRETNALFHMVFLQTTTIKFNL